MQQWRLVKVALCVTALVPLTRGQEVSQPNAGPDDTTEVDATVVDTAELPVQGIADSEPTVATPMEESIEVRDNQGQLDCTTDKRTFDPRVHEKVYHIGVHAIRGFDSAYREYNKTFSEYLTATAGQRFDPPIRFEMTPVNFQGLFDSVENEEVDFVFANPGIYSCIGVEQGAQPLATVISRLEVRGHTYDLDVYGGVMFTRVDNDEVNGVSDLRDKIIGGGGISDLMGTQLQFYEMNAAGLSYVMDPKQVVFTGNQDKVVQGVIDGEFDVGFVRTDQIERSKDVYGNTIDPELFKIIEPKIFVLDNGELFPFLHSTDIYPEWPVAAMDYVPKDVAEEVQEALIALQSHAQAHEQVQAGGPWDPSRCDTTPDLAKLAWEASTNGNMAGFRTARSYFEVRTMHEAAGFMLQDEKDNWRCTRADTLYDSIKCPEEHYKLPIEEYEEKCASMGLVCKEGYDCYCRPCVKAFEVDVYELTPEMSEMHNTKHKGCEKMSLCGSVEQTKIITFHAVDNKKRENVDVEVKMHLATTTSNLMAVPIGDYTYEIQWTETNIGVGIMEIFIDGVQIPESPIRVQVEDRNCELDFPGQRRSNNAGGDCECHEGTMDISGRCVESTIIAVVISVAAVLVVAGLGVCWLRWKNHKNDQMWLVNIDELQFDDPPEVIGQGSFGVVLLGQYRGTKVALKRALRVKANSSRHSKRSRRKGSGVISNTNTSSVGMNSIGMSSVSTDEQSPNDPELASGPTSDDGGASNTGSRHSRASSKSSNSGDRSGSFHGSRHGSGGGSRSASYNPNSLGFLAEDYGRQSKLAWLFPWMKRNDYHSRFKETILGATNSTSFNSSKSWHSVLCPWFSPAVRREEEFIQEMRTLSRLRHPCITTVLGAVISRSHDPMLVMEYMEYGSLHDLLSNETMHLSGEIILQVARDVTQGLRFLHSSKPPIMHGDLKGRNILIDSRFRAKLCDFGLSTKKQSLITGTPFWLAPEYLRGQTGYTTQCDIYSVAIVLYEMYAREDPYKGEDFRDTLRKVCDRRVNKRPVIPSTCPQKMADLMKKCWSPDPFFRPQAKDLDTTLLDMNMRDCEPMSVDEQNARKERPTGDMLYDLFPKHVADQLKAGQKVEPESHDEVTIVFSDIVHFTDISKTLTPLKVSQMLDRLYLAFDKVARKNKVFKVETIGDAYMGVTNLEKKQMETHTKNAADFAIDLVKEASKILIDEEDPSRGHINIRVGFHSGAVVSNVIGSLNPRYSLFGDAISVATKMEQNSKANRVLCSEAAYKHLIEQAPEIDVRKRGKLAITGKGDMNVYWVGGDAIAHGDLHGEPVSDGRHVDFQEQAPGAKDGIDTIDDHLWRRELQGQLQRLDSGGPQEEQAPPPTKKEFSKATPAKESAPPTKNSYVKRSVKEATLFVREKHT